MTTPWSSIAGLRVVDIDSNEAEQFICGNIPDKHLWAYRHILEHDCGSVSCGRTVYQLIHSTPLQEQEKGGV